MVFPINEPYTVFTYPTNEVEIPCINLENIAQDDLAKNEFFARYLAQNRKPMEQVTYWFHGTDRESARIIIQQGIDVDKGKSQLDFSDGAGFYLTR